MIFGKADPVDGVLHTNNDSYALSPNTSFSVMRPFRMPGIAGAVLLVAFGIAFWDLLYAVELAGIGAGAAVSLLVGNTLAHLVIINRDLQGSELSIAVWGTYRHVNRRRREIAQAVRSGRTA